eukprot:TRINITY_DN4489_c0_g1_i1.p1 TRINITY_DN4489_c0_g1~~TRINITY_DN4489_c0_g1_i1.p1  ORF type:complete len:298 (+),score=72.42 TRINITY_DN4489_c0_g1_i1:303-1196(+)
MKKRQLEAIISQPEEQVIVQPPKNPAKRRQCHCKNSKCLKLYCECFAAGEFCDGCICQDCHNTYDNKEMVERAKNVTLERNPTAFAPKVNSPKTESGKHSRGCTCKKTGCLKRYCECFQARVFCSGNCRCLDCKNFHGSEERQALVEVSDYTTKAPEPVVKEKKVAPVLTAAEMQAQSNFTESVKRVFKHITDPTVLNSLCEVLIQAANDEADPSTRKEEVNNNNNNNANTNESKEELKSEEHLLMLQERAVLQNFTKFMKRTSGILQKTVEQYQAVPFSSTARNLSTPLSSNKNGS